MTEHVEELSTDSTPEAPAHSEEASAESPTPEATADSSVVDGDAVSATDAAASDLTEPAGKVEDEPAEPAEAAQADSSAVDASTEEVAAEEATAEADTVSAAPEAEPTDASEASEAAASDSDPASDSESEQESTEEAPAEAVSAKAEGVDAGEETPASKATTAAAVTAPAETPQPPAATGRRLEVLNSALESYKSKLPVEGKVIGWNKGGFHVSLAGLGAFCPRSQIEIGNPRHPATYIDKDFSFMIAEMDDAGRRVVLNRASLLAEQRKSQRAELKKALKVDAVLEGRIDSLSDFGAFVDLGGGMRGLIHVSQLSHERVEKPEEAVSVGDRVKVKVLKVENGGKRISLSRKALEPDPWQGIEERFVHGQTFSATIVRRTEFGLFSMVEPGIEGLIHTSQLTIGSNIDDKKYDPGETVEGWVREVNADRHRLALTLRELPEGDPWKDLGERYEEGSLVEGMVEQVAKFGFFVTLEPGLTGLLPFSAVTAPAGRRRENAYRVGQDVKVVLLELDARRKRISLGLEGAQAEGSKSDFKNFQKGQDDGASGLNAMAAAFAKLNTQ